MDYETEEGEEEDHNLPIWYNQARTFIDFKYKEALEFNDILNRHLPSLVNHWDCDEENGWIFEFDDLNIEVINTMMGPLEVKATSWSMPRTYIDPLRHSLRDLLYSQLDGMNSIKDFASILLLLTEEATIHLHEWKNGTTGKGTKEERGWDLRQIDSLNIKDYITSNSQGADLNTFETSADDLLGTSIKKICEGFPAEYRILHVEPVFRTDLVSRFQRRQHEMYEELMTRSYTKLRACVSSKIIARGSSLDNKEDLARELCKTKATFHGTQRHKVSSIVRYGFVIPGQKAGDTQIDIASGASYGIGVYTSPSAEYALCYSGSYGTKTSLSELPGIRLIVCAVLMGLPLSVSRQDTRRITGVAKKMAHSHVSPNELEYIVFNAAQVIPCYAVHLDFGAEFAKAELAKAPDDPNKFARHWHKVRDKLEKETYVAPAEIQEQKQARKAAAAKCFPYGFGPATGTSFVIEEIGEVSDDEEDYGEYQGMRIEVGDEVSKWEETTAGGASWFDEYQKSRVTYGNL